MVGLYEAIAALGLNIKVLDLLYAKIPYSSYGFGCLVPGILGCVLGGVIYALMN